MLKEKIIIILVISILMLTFLFIFSSKPVLSDSDNVTIFWRFTDYITSKQLSGGFLKPLGYAQQVQVRINSKSYYIGIVKIEDVDVTINISTTNFSKSPIQRTLSNEEEKFDLNNDSFYDLSITYTSLSEYRIASLFFKSINESISQIADLTNITNASSTNNTVNQTSNTAQNTSNNANVSNNQTANLTSEKPSKNLISLRLPSKNIFKNVLLWIIIISGICIFSVMIALNLIKKKKEENEVIKSIMQKLRGLNQNNNSKSNSSPDMPAPD